MHSTDHQNQRNNDPLSMWIEASDTFFKEMNTVFPAANLYSGPSEIAPDHTGAFMKDLIAKWNSYHQKQEACAPEKNGQDSGARESCEPASFVRDGFTLLSRIYENGPKKFSTIPQIGLTRSYQEQLFQLVDRYTFFVTQLSEFMALNLQPITDTFAALQKEQMDSSHNGTVPQHHKTYYHSWIKQLEANYQTFLKSKPYTQKMDQTLTAMKEYILVRDGLIQDMLKPFPIATKHEMEELSKDIYQLKKRITQLESSSSDNTRTV